MKNLRFFTQKDKGRRGDLFVEWHNHLHPDSLFFLVNRERHANWTWNDSTILDREQVTKLRDELTAWLGDVPTAPTVPKWTEESRARFERSGCSAGTRPVTLWR